MSTDEQNRTEADTVAELARQAVEVELLDVEGTVAAIAAGGGAVKILDLEQYDARPRRLRATRTVYDAGSLVAYLQRHSTSSTEVYADAPQARIEAIIDASDGEVPGFGEHRIVLKLTKSPAWIAWTRNDGQLLPQVEFAEFAELHAGDVHQPSPADLLELAQHLEATRSVEFESGQRLADGQTRLAYKETIQARAGQRGDIEIPSVIRLRLAPYIGGPTYAVTARFRYRMLGQTLKLGYVLDQPDRILEAAFDDVVEVLREGPQAITAPIFLGQP